MATVRAYRAPQARSDRPRCRAAHPSNPENPLLRANNRESIAAPADDRAVPGRRVDAENIELAMGTLPSANHRPETAASAAALSCRLAAAALREPVLHSSASGPKTSARPRAPE